VSTSHGSFFHKYILFKRRSRTKRARLDVIINILCIILYYRDFNIYIYNNVKYAHNTRVVCLYDSVCVLIVPSQRRKKFFFLYFGRFYGVRQIPLVHTILYIIIFKYNIIHILLLLFSYLLLLRNK